MLAALAVLFLSIADVVGALMLIFHIKFLSTIIGIIILLKGISGFASALSSGFIMDIFSILDIITGLLLLTQFSLPLPYSAVGTVHLIKGLIMVLLSIPYNRL